MTATEPTTGCPSWCVVPREYHQAETAPIHIGRTLDLPAASVEPQLSTHPAARDQTGVYVHIESAEEILQPVEAEAVADAIVRALVALDPTSALRVANRMLAAADRAERSAAFSVNTIPPR